MSGKKVSDVFKWIIDQVDPLLGLLLALFFSVAGILGLTNQNVLASATLATLTLLAITLIRERKGRETLEYKINRLLGNIESPPPDLFFKRSTNENSLLKEAESEAWLVQETGSLITEKNQSEIIGLLQRGGKVKAVVTAPTEGTARLMAFRNASLAHDTIIARYTQFRGQVVSILDRIDANAERLEVRFIPYPIGATCVIVDPHHAEKSKRRAVVRYAGFGVPYPEKPDFGVRGDTSPQTFSHFIQESQRMFENASKIVLLTGPPRSGKTTAMEGLVQSHKNNPHLFYVIVRALTSGADRTGFEVLTSAEPTPKRFATRKSDGTYEVVADVWSSVTSQLEEAYKSKKVMLLDEIGPLQLQTPKFVNLVNQIIDDPSVTMFATVALDNSHYLIQKVKRHYRSTVLELNSNKDSNDIQNSLRQELKVSLRLVDYIPHTLWEGVKL